MLEAQNTGADKAVYGPPVDHITEGERFFSEGRLSEAKAMFQAAADLCPGHAMAWNNLAVIAMSENDDREAERFLLQALEIKSDFLEARQNLAEIYSLRGQWGKAAREFRKILEFKPADLPTVRRLAQVYVNMGEADKAQTLMSESESVGALRSFIDSLWLGIKYYSMVDGLSTRDKLEKFVAAILKFLDGQGGRSPSYKLLRLDPETGSEVTLEGFFDAFYYKESRSLNLSAEGETGGPELVLTIGDHDDWKFFSGALRNEMRAEGGCLGDFTQTRKILRREARLSRYNLEATLNYFRDNVGPCDCHVHRAVLV
jgi:tetratricopeptide (TPR) repeat protein